MREKAVVIMYPDSRMTGGGLLGDRIREISLLVGDFYQTVTRIMEGYKALDFSLLGITYNDTTTTTLSPLYPHHLFEQLIPVGITFDDWPNENHRPKHEQLLKELLPELDLSPQALAVVGGYHFKDCVQTMTNVLNFNGCYAKINPLLTDQLGPIVVARRVNRLTSIPAEDDLDFLEIL